MEGSSCQFKVKSWNFPGGTEKNHKKPVSIAGNQAEI
jgi:hypothetical protein